MDVETGGPWTLGQLALLIGENQEINEGLRKQFESTGGAWFVASLPAILNELADVRNPAAHSASLDRDSVRRLRSRYVGVGCEGELVRLSKVGVR